MSEVQPTAAGVRIGGLGRRFLAQLIDGIFPALITGVFAAVAWFNWTQNVLLVAGIAYAVLLGGWAVLVWWMFAARGAGPGMRALRLELVGAADGAPIGWGRFFLRQLILGACAALALPLVVLVIMLIVNPRKQGWHDLAARSIVIAERSRKRAASTSRAPARAAVAASAASTTVGLPAHVAPRGFAPQAPGSVTTSQPEPVRGSPEVQPTPAPQYVTAQASFGRPQTGAAIAPPGQPYPGSVQPQSQYPAAFAGPQPPGQAQGQPAPQQYAQQQAPQQYPRQQAPRYAPPQQPVPQHYAQPPQQFIGQPYGQPVPQHPLPQFPQPPQAGPPGGFPAAPPPGWPPSAHSQASAGLTSADDGGTRIARRNEGAAQASWIIRLDDGREVPVGALVLIGRNPQPRPGEEGARLVKAGENGRMVSKTHLAIGQDERGLFVMDRGSTNGTAVANSGGEYEPCPAGDPVRLREGQVVSFGEHTLTVRRG